MRKGIIPSVIVLIIFTGAIFAGCVGAQPPEKVSVIVGFKEKPDKDVIRSHGGEVKHEYHIIPAIACSLPQKAIDALKKNPVIAYVEEDLEVQALDTELDNSWGVKRIGAGVVHGYNKGKGVKVGIIDTGIDYTHPDLDANYKGGYDFVNRDADPRDDNGHGTHCAGIVAAEDNGVGVVGVAPEAYIYAVKVLDRYGSGSISNVILGIQWCVDNKMQIVSMSLGTSTYSQSLKDACDNAYKAGLVLVASAGNSGDGNINTNEYSYPAAFDSVIAVGATDKTDRAASWSNSGPYLELAAPGVSIYSTLPTYSVTNSWRYGYNYGTLSGTSMACPHVSGVATLIKASEPTLTNADIRLRLQVTADDLGPLGLDNLYGYGLVDADEKVTKTDLHDVAVRSITAPSSVVPGSVATVKVEVANEGTFEETFNVTLTDNTDSVDIGRISITLPASATTLLSFSWDTSYASLGTHTLEAKADVVVNETEVADNSKTIAIKVANLVEKTYSPQGIYITLGTLISGGYNSLFSNDGVYLKVNSTKYGFGQYTDWYSYVKISEDPSKVTSLEISYDGKYSTSLTQKIYIYNFALSRWDSIDSRTVGTSDTKITWATSSPGSYISSMGEIRLRVYAGSIFYFTCHADFVSYKIVA